MADDVHRPGAAAAAPGARTAPAATSSGGPGPLPVLLFVYGTLQPGERAWHLLAPSARSAERTSVEGALWDTRLGYPALTLAAEALAEVPGVVVELDPARAERVLEQLDTYEEVHDSHYVRRRVVTSDGRAAWAYDWVGPTTGFRRIERWAPSVENPDNP